MWGGGESKAELWKKKKWVLVSFPHSTTPLHEGDDEKQIFQSPSWHPPWLFFDHSWCAITAFLGWLSVTDLCLLAVELNISNPLHVCIKWLYPEKCSTLRKTWQQLWAGHQSTGPQMGCHFVWGDNVKAIGRSLVKVSNNKHLVFFRVVVPGIRY